MAFRGQVTQVEALRDPGLGAASSLIGGTIGSLLSERINKKRNATDLLQSLIGGGATLGSAIYKAEADKDLEQQKMKNNMLANAAMLGIDLEAPSGTEITEQPQPGSDVTTITPPQTSFDKTTPYQGQQLVPVDLKEGQAPSPTSPDLSKKSLSGGLGVQSQPQLPPALQRLAYLNPDRFAIVAQKMGYLLPGQIDQTRLSKMQEELDLLKQTKGNTIRKSGADATTAELTAQEKGVTSKFSSPEFLEGNQTQEATDISGASLGQPLTPRMKTDRTSLATLPEARKADIIQQTGSAPGALSQFVQNGLKVIELRNSNTIDRVRLRLIAEGKLDQLGQLRPDEEAVINFRDQVAPLVIKTAGADQGANSISNRDIEGIGKSLGDPTASYNVFKRNFAQFVAKGYLSGLRNAQSVDAFAYKQMKKELESLTGQPFNYDKDASDLPGITEKILNNFNKPQRVSKSISSVPQKTSQPKTYTTKQQEAADIFKELGL